MRNSGKMITRALTQWLVASCLLLPSSLLADVPSYALSSGSSLTFTATQNSAPVKGEFKRFHSTIRFAPEKLNESRIAVEVELASLAMADQDMESTLKAPDWFAMEAFPKAVFVSNTIKRIPGGTDYTAEGTLTLKGKKLPLTLYFVVDKLTDRYAHATGHAEILRNSYAVGGGEWAATDALKNEVRVDFVISAERE